MKPYYLAIDIGASGGRHILGWVEDHQIFTEEVYRFENGFTEKNGYRVWDTDALFTHVKAGLAACKKIGKIPYSVGIDTWGVDFVLTDATGNRLTEAVAYRDDRTVGMDAYLQTILPESELYARTGIQKQLYNTIYQLLALKKSDPDVLLKAEHFLMIPDYLHSRLCGIMANEYTNASTTQLLDAAKKDWDYDLIQKIGIPEKLFSSLRLPGAVLGELLPEVAKEIGFSCKVVLPATHDTASAVMAIPAPDENAIFLSSGTWSLIGTEQKRPICSEQAQKANFTNEGGYQYRFRFLKNIMGLWMIQSVRRELGKKYSYEDLCVMAKACADFPVHLDVNDSRFLAPSNMIEAIKSYCADTHQTVPQTIGEIAACIYQGLSDAYQTAVVEMEQVTGRSYSKLYLVGGGSKDHYLNELTKEKTKKIVSAGPTEGTAIGNLCAQMINGKEFADLFAARAAIRASFAIKEV